MVLPKLVICKAKRGVHEDLNHALTVTHDLYETHGSFVTLICCASEDGLQRDNVLMGQEGFQEEFFYRTDLVCHARHGCGGTLPSDHGRVVACSGIGIFRRNSAKGYIQCETAQTHFVLAQVSDIDR